MGNLDYKQFTERRRPHIHHPGATLFLTYLLAGSIPKTTLNEYKSKRDWLNDQLARARKANTSNNAAELKRWLERIERFKREWFVKFEDILHRAKTGPMWMQDDRVAAKVVENLHRLDGDAYRLDAFSVMSNHVHAVFGPFLSESELHEDVDEDGHPVFISQHPSLSRTMHSLKARIARECKLILSRSGQFWEQESFDHVIRPGKFDATVRYVLNNPVKAGLVNDWRDWRGNYCRKELLTIVSDKL